MSLRSKLFGAFLVLIIVPLAVLAAALYTLVTGLIEEKHSRQTELTLRALSQSVGFIFREMNQVTDSTIASDAIQDVLSDAYSGDVEDIDYLNLNEVQQKFRELLVYHPSVSYALMYALDNGRIHRIFTKEQFQAMPYERFIGTELYRRVLERGGLPLWVGPYEYPELTGSEPVFTQIRVVKDIDTLSDKGILLVQIKNSGLESVFRYFRYRQDQLATRFFIVNGDGLVLYDSGGALNGQRLGELTERPLALDAAYRSVRNRFDGQDSVISSIGLDIEDWRLVSVTSWHALSSEVLLYSRWVAAVLLLCFVSALVFIWFFANRIARAIVQTVRVMGQVERGDLTARLPLAGNDETSLLARGFNRLVSRLAELLEEVKRQQERKTRAELQALQAQIKPHFLFNALESINALAVQNEGQKVSRMVTRLGSMLRISILQREEITVAQELDHVLSYLEIQKYRFDDLFQFEIDVPPELMNCLMPKLTLQPLVENCIQHGFEGIGYMGLIRLTAREEGERIVFYVEDNGIGIPPERLAAIEAGPDDDAGHGDAPETGERRGLGVRNVADRIRIRYGKRYGLFICSAPGRGTVIKIVVPKTAGGVDREAESPAR
jgi:sensor histidine kinase YesM